MYTIFSPLSDFLKSACGGLVAALHSLHIFWSSRLSSTGFGHIHDDHFAACCGHHRICSLDKASCLVCPSSRVGTVLCYPVVGFCPGYWVLNCSISFWTVVMCLSFLLNCFSFFACERTLVYMIPLSAFFLARELCSANSLHDCTHVTKLDDCASHSSTIMALHTSVEQ